MKPIEESLLAVPGVEQAHVRVSDTGPAGVRIVLADDSDRLSVADSVRELFSERGLSVQMAGNLDVPDEPDAPDAPASIADSVVPAQGDLPGALAVAVSEGVDHCDVAVRIQGEGAESRRAVRRSSVGVVAIREAIVDALAEVTGRTGIRPSIMSVDERDVAGVAVLTVVLSVGGAAGVGSAVVRATRFHAFGSAARAAMATLP